MGIVTVLGACSSTKEVKQIIPATPNIAKQSTPFDQDSGFFSGQNPAMTIIKSGKTLNLVRIMDGAACKNEFEGAKGSFLLYADPTDIERIKREQGVKVFTEFENKNDFDCKKEGQLCDGVEYCYTDIIYVNKTTE